MTTALATKKVMIVETNEQDAQESARALSKVDGAEIALLTPSVSLALDKITKETPYLVVIDEKVQGWQDFCRQVSTQAKVVVTTDHQSGELQSEAKRVGAKAILAKPIHKMQSDLPSLFEERRKEQEMPSWDNQEPSMSSVFEAQNHSYSQLQENRGDFGQQGMYSQSPFTQSQPVGDPQQMQNQRQTESPMQHGNMMMPPQQMGYQPQMQQPPMQGGMQMFNQAPPRPKMIVTVYSPKGGVGKTTMSLNLAVAIRKLSAERLGEQNAFHVGLVDFDVDFGDVAASLQLVPRGSVVDWPKEEDFNPEYVQGLFTFHPPSNVAILAGPERPEMEFMLNEEQARYVISGTHKIFDIVVVDMGYSLRKSSLLAMSMATHPMFVTTPDTPAVRDMTRAKKSLEEHNINLNRSQLILNKVPRKGKPPLSTQEVKRYIGMPIAGEVQEDPKVLEALSEGTPLTLKGKSPAAMAIEDIAYSFIGDYLPKDNHKKSFFKRMFGGK